jgi:4-aminobutyrate aminotransferase-like enzyme
MNMAGSDCDDTAESRMRRTSPRKLAQLTSDASAIPDIRGLGLMWACQKRPHPG